MHAYLVHRDTLRRLCWVDGCILIHAGYDLFQSVPTLCDLDLNNHGRSNMGLARVSFCDCFCGFTVKVVQGSKLEDFVCVFIAKRQVSPPARLLCEGPALWPPSVQRGFKVEEDLWLIVCFRCLPWASHIARFHGFKQRF